MILEPLEPLTIRVCGEIRELVPGQPVELSEEHARRLLEKAGTKVRLVSPDRAEPIAIEDASTTPRPIYWASMDGTMHGPAYPELLAMVGTGPAATFWVMVMYGSGLRWIRDDRLRRRPQPETRAQEA